MPSVAGATGAATAETPFADAALFYERYRPPYPKEALDHVVEALGLSRSHRVLDLGCGPGSLAIPLSGRVDEVVALDIDPVMIEQGKRSAAAGSAGPIRWIQASAEDLTSDLGTFDGVVLGQSFHWMDRDLVLKNIEPLLANGGGIAVLDILDQAEPAAWETIVRTTVARYLGERPRRHPKASQEIPHELALARSRAFSTFSVRTFPTVVTRGVPSVLGYLYSGTGTGRPLFGDRLLEFEEDLTQALLDHDPSGAFESTMETRVIVAHKAGGRTTTQQDGP